MLPHLCDAKDNINEVGEEPFRFFSHFFYVSMFEFLSTCTIGIQGKRVGCHPHIVSLF